MEHVAGSVGDGAAAEYVGFLKIMKRLPDASKIISDPDGGLIPEGNDVQWATIAKLSSVLTAAQRRGDLEVHHAPETRNDRGRRQDVPLGQPKGLYVCQNP